MIIVIVFSILEQLGRQSARSIAALGAATVVLRVCFCFSLKVHSSTGFFSTLLTHIHGKYTHTPATTPRHCHSLSWPGKCQIFVIVLIETRWGSVAGRRQCT